MPQEFPIDLISDAFRSTVIEFIHLTIFFFFHFCIFILLQIETEEENKFLLWMTTAQQHHQQWPQQQRRHSAFVVSTVSIWRKFEIKCVRIVTRHLNETYLRKHRFTFYLSCLNFVIIGGEQNRGCCDDRSFYVNEIITNWPHRRLFCLHCFLANDKWQWRPSVHETVLNWNRSKILHMM